MAQHPRTLLAFQLALLISMPGRCASSVNPSTNTFVIGDRTFDHDWITKTSMPTKGSDMTATTVGDTIYLIGGCTSDQLWVNDPPYSSYRCSAVTARTTRYHPLLNTFDSSWSDAPRARYRHAAAAVAGKIYLLGGVDGTDTIVPQVDVLDIATGTWSTLPESMPYATTDLCAWVHGGRIYAAGGYSAAWEAMTTTQIFDPTASASSAWSAGPTMAQGRGDTFAAVQGGKAYILGGFHDGNNFESPLSGLEMLDMSTSGTSWTPRRSMSIARGDKAVATLNGIIHVVGGETKNAAGHSVPLNDVEAYDPITDTWYSGGSIPSQRFRFTAAVHGSSIFIFGGQGYLVGAHGAAGSHYPVLSTVEAYKEEVTVRVSGAVAVGMRILPMCLALFVAWTGV
mmetsp:Transcript_114685/g.255867  ORF Transcript_114685/g.255867 Transcript_114685/m.255867 type:complete len:397 (-) Transcript_114685:160-1350(-)